MFFVAKIVITTVIIYTILERGNILDKACSVFELYAAVALANRKRFDLLACIYRQWNYVQL